MSIKLVLILQLLITTSLFAEDSCTANNTSCLKEMSQNAQDKGDLESSLKLSMADCLFNRDCKEFNIGMARGFHKDSSIPSFYEAIQFYVEKELLKQRNENQKSNYSPYKEDNGKLKKENNFLHLKIKSLSDEKADLNSEISFLRETLDKAKKSIASKEKKLSAKQNVIQLEKELKEAIKQKENESSNHAKEKSNFEKIISSLESENIKLNNEIKLQKEDRSNKEENVSPVIWVAKEADSAFKNLTTSMGKNSGTILLALIILIVGFIIVGFITYFYKNIKSQRLIRKMDEIDEAIENLKNKNNIEKEHLYD